MSEASSAAVTVGRGFGCEFRDDVDVKPSSRFEKPLMLSQYAEPHVCACATSSWPNVALSKLNAIPIGGTWSVWVTVVAPEAGVGGP